MCEYLKEVAKQVYSGKKFMNTRVRIMLTTMEKFFKAQDKPTRLEGLLERSGGQAAQGPQGQEPPLGGRGG